MPRKLDVLDVPTHFSGHVILFPAATEKKKKRNTGRPAWPE